MSSYAARRCVCPWCKGKVKPPHKQEVIENRVCKDCNGAYMIAAVWGGCLFIAQNEPAQVCARCRSDMPASRLAGENARRRLCFRCANAVKGPVC